MGIKIDDQVEVVQPVVGGSVLDVQYDASVGKLRALVQLGEDQQRWFYEDELTIVQGA